MADTPLTTIPIVPNEQQILDRLLEARADLILLKQDRSTYIKSRDVMPLYHIVVEQMEILSQNRKGVHEKNEADRVLEECLQLVSLFFMTIGRNNEAPAAYAIIITILRLLFHLTEAALYSEKDLVHISQTLERLGETVKKSKDKHPSHLITLLVAHLETCNESCLKLQAQLKRLDPGVAETHEKLISILRSISLANTKAKFSNSEVKDLQDQLKEIDAQRVAGNFVNEKGEKLAGSDEVSDLLGCCLLWSEVVLERKGEIPEPFKETYVALVGLRNELEKLSLTQAWSLRETDLYDFQRQLDKIDESRVNGNFVDRDGIPAELYVQRTLLYLVRRSYGYIYYLMVCSEPVSEALLPVYNQLQTLRRCLVEVKNSGGVNSLRELYPYSMKLHSMENMRVDGKFMVGDDVPDDQESVNELLSECFDLIHQLRVATQSESQDDVNDS